MFDFAGSEIALVAVVALILIGPKDLPVAIKAVTGVIKKARRMAGEFQVHVDDMMKEADLGDLRSGLNDLRRMDIKGRILNAVDGDGTVRRSVTDATSDVTSTAWSPPPAPLPDTPAPEAVAFTEPVDHGVGVPGLTETAILPAAEHSIAPPHLMGDPEPAEAREIPAFIPPRAARSAPAFIPPRASQV